MRLIRKDGAVLRKIKIALLMFILVLIVAGIIKDKVFDTPENCLKKLRSLSMQDNPKVLTYKMYFWSLIPMGELTFETSKSDAGTVFSAQAVTKSSFLEKFMTASARVESHSDREDLLPYKYVERTEVKGKIKEKEVLYDRERLLAIRGDKKIKIPEGTYDPLGAFVRLLALRPEKDIEHNILFISGGDLYNLKAMVMSEKQGIKEISIDMRRANKTSSHGATFSVWTTADNGLPLAFKSWTPVGYASVVLDKLEVQ